MTNSSDRIRNLTENFVRELEQAIRESALESVQSALLGGAQSAPTRRGPKPTVSSAPKRARKASGKRGKRTPEQVEADGMNAVDYVRGNPGCPVGDIGTALGLSTKDLRLPLLRLVEAGTLRTEGQKRGTRYFPGSGKAKRAKKSKRAKRR